MIRDIALFARLEKRADESTLPSSGEVAEAEATIVEVY